MMNPCPHCGEKDRLISTTTFVECGKCGMRGPLSTPNEFWQATPADRTKAIELWDSLPRKQPEKKAPTKYDADNYWTDREGRIYKGNIMSEPTFDYDHFGMQMAPLQRLEPNDRQWTSHELNVIYKMMEKGMEK